MNIIDVHVHLGNVCGPFCGEEKFGKIKASLKPNLLERLDYNRALVDIVGSVLFPLPPIVKIAKNAASIATADSLLEEMDKNNVHQSILLPIEPFVKTSDILKFSKQFPDRFIPFASIDFSSRNPAIVYKFASECLSNYPFRGIKFHPNLQNIHPASDLAHTLYEFADKKKLILIIHGGITPILRGPSRFYSIPENLISILKNYSNISFIISHAGNYFRRDFDFLKNISTLKNIWVDTSGIGSEIIYAALVHLGQDKVLFGSDWPYGTQKYGIKLLKKAVKRFCKGYNETEVLEKVLWKNANRLLSI